MSATPPEKKMSVEFEAWPEDEIIASTKLLSDKAMLASFRLVVRTVSCTEKQLSEEFARVDPNDVELLLDQWNNTADRLRALANVVDGAVARWCIAAPLGRARRPA